MQELGSVLRSAREACGLSLDDIQQLTKIRTRYLKAIEEGDLDSLPGIVYARGFIKSYAEQVGLNGQALLEEHGLAASTSPIPNPKPVASDKLYRTQGGLNERTISYLWQGALIIVVIGVVAVALKYYTDHQPPRSPVPSSMLSQSANTPGTNAIGLKSTNTAANANDTNKTGSGNQDKSAPKPEPTAPLDPTSKTPGVQSTFTLPAESPLSVDITATSGDCWIDVFSDNKEIEQLTLKPGDKRSYTASTDLKIVTGASPHITMMVGKQPVVLEPVFGKYIFEFHH